MTNVRWFGVYQHSWSPNQFTSGIGFQDPKTANHGIGAPLLYLLRVKMKDGSVPPDQIPPPPSF